MAAKAPVPPPPPAQPIDAGAQALADALHSSFGIVKFVMLLLFLAFLFSGFFTVGPREQAILLRFGKPQGEGDKVLLGPGIHFGLPYPIDEVVRIPITEVQEVRSRTHWFFQTPVQEAQGEIPFAGPTLNPEVDGYVLTGDGNILHTKAVLRYRIEDPVRCVFEFSSGGDQAYGLNGLSNAVLNVLDNALVYAAAQSRVDQALFERTAFQDAVQRRVNQLVQAEQLGIAVEQCVVETRQPRQLDTAFANVTTAGQKARQALTEALTYRDKKLNEAAGEAAARRNTAQAERNDMLAKLNGDAKTFQEVLPRYRANPALFRQQRLAETLGRALAGVDYKMYLPSHPDGRPLELRLNLNRAPVKSKPESPQP
ncbi:MAG TPA: SPFH domain-containing protein [Verrucomicrobiota bacterium]|nr:SPFH domain-containing protein [Verrucomicrobiota bacterium]HNT13632.1 SPFH domain-containing protein [Verrucomicrobiota bacterium]